MVDLKLTVRFLTDATLIHYGASITFSHAVGAADFSRVELGQVKLLVDHNPSVMTQVGNVLSAYSDGHASFAEIELYDFDDPLIRKVRYLLESGKHNGLSAGLAQAATRKVGTKQYMIDKWVLNEISVVSVPADPHTATNLSFSMPFIVNADGSIEKFSVSKSEELNILTVDDAKAQYKDFMKRYT